MKNRMKSGAACGLIVAAVFVTSRFGMEVVAQQDATRSLPPAENDPFRSDDSVSLTPASSGADPFGGEAAESKPNPEPLSHDDRSDAHALPSGTVPVSADSDDARSAESYSEHKLQIIRLRNVSAESAYEVVGDMFEYTPKRSSWFLEILDQTNSLIVQAPVKLVEQVRELAEELDRVNPRDNVDYGSTLDVYEIPDVSLKYSKSVARSSSVPLLIRTLKLRNADARSFQIIAENLLEQQHVDSDVDLSCEPATNRVIVRGPGNLVDLVQQLAEKIDRSVVSAAAADVSLQSPDHVDSSESPYPADEQLAARMTDSDFESESRRLHEQIAQLDAESVNLASEVRSLQKQFGKQHPKIAGARGQLKSLLEKSFHTRLRLQEQQVAAVRNRLSRIESQVQQRSRLREQIIERRFRELLDEDDNLSWSVSETGRGSSSVDPVVALEPAGGADASAKRYPATVAGARPQDAASGVSLPTTEAESGPAGLPVIDDIAEMTVPPGTPVRRGSFPLHAAADAGLNAATPQQELIMAQHALEIARLKLERAESQLERWKQGSLEREQARFEREIAQLELARSQQLLDETRRRLDAQREVLRLELLQRQNRVDAAMAVYEQSIEVNDRSPGAVSESELRRLRLDLESARLDVEAVNAELMRFERISGSTETTAPVEQSPVSFDGPAEIDVPAEPVVPGTNASRQSKTVTELPPSSTDRNEADQTEQGSSEDSLLPGIRN